MPIIVLEGMTGAGKTTAAETLKVNFDAIVFSNPPPEFLSKIKCYFNEYQEDTIARAVFFLASARYLDIKIRKLLDDRPDTVIVLDRYWYTTLAAHLAHDFIYNDSCNREKIKKIIIEGAKELLVPDLVLFLDVDIKTRDKRILIREENNKLKKSDIWHSTGAKYQSLFERYNLEYKELFDKLRSEKLNIIKIDTTTISKSEANSIILRSVLEVVKISSTIKKVTTN